MQDTKELIKLGFGGIGSREPDIFIENDTSEKVDISQVSVMQAQGFLEFIEDVLFKYF